MKKTTPEEPPPKENSEAILSAAFIPWMDPNKIATGLRDRYSRDNSISTKEDDEEYVVEGKRKWWTLSGLLLKSTWHVGKTGGRWSLRCERSAIPNHFWALLDDVLNYKRRSNPQRRYVAGHEFVGGSWPSYTFVVDGKRAAIRYLFQDPPLSWSLPLEYLLCQCLNDHFPFESANRFKLRIT